MSATTYQPKLKECDNCKGAGTSVQIYFVKKGVKPDGKNDWELHNADGSIHTHVAGASKGGGGGRKFFGGYSKPRDIEKVVLVPFNTEDLEAAAKVQADAQALGFKINVLSNGQVQFETDAQLGQKYVVMVKERPTATS